RLHAPPVGRTCAAAGGGAMYHGGVSRLSCTAVMAFACGAFACGGEDVVSIELHRVAPAADPLCGAPADARTLVITALGDFSAAEGRAVSHSIGDDSR